MAVNKDFRVKKGLVVGENIDATAGNLSAVNITATGTLTAASFSPAAIVASQSVSSVSISADNFYGNVNDVTYSELSITGGLSSDGINLTNAAGDTGLGTLDAVSATVSNGVSGAIFTIPTAQYRSGKIVVQAVAVQATPSAMETTELLYVQGLSTINWIEYATVGIGSEQFVTYTGVINGTNVEFRATNNYSVPLNFVSSISQLYTVT
jgi:hypothetical protein